MNHSGPSLAERVMKSTESGGFSWMKNDMKKYYYGFNSPTKSFTTFMSAIILDQIEYPKNRRFETRKYLSTSAYSKTLKSKNRLLCSSDKLHYLEVKLVKPELEDIELTYLLKPNTDIPLTYYIKVPKIYKNVTFDKESLIKLLNSRITELIFEVDRLEVVNIEKWLPERDQRITAVWLADTDASPDKKGLMYSLPIDVANMVIGYI